MYFTRMGNNTHKSDLIPPSRPCAVWSIATGLDKALPVADLALPPAAIFG
jgi:hypothetical protein